PHADVASGLNYFRCVSMSGTGLWKDSCSVSKFSCNKVRSGLAAVNDGVFGLCNNNLPNPSDSLRVDRSVKGTDHEITQITNPTQYLFYVGDNDETSVASSDLALFVPAGNSTEGGEWFKPHGEFQGVTFPLCVLQRGAGGT
ncbi:hypothetical protein EBZ37_13880, partial [bacterium]|nr:hypothetical protein [bacterium]